MAGWVQADAHAAVQHGLTVGQTLQRQPGAESAAQHALADSGGEHLAVTGAGMVGVGMGDHRVRHCPRGVDVEVARRTVQALRTSDDQVFHGHMPDGPARR